MLGTERTLAQWKPTPAGGGNGSDSCPLEAVRLVEEGPLCRERL